MVEKEKETIFAQHRQVPYQVRKNRSLDYTDSPFPACGSENHHEPSLHALCGLAHLPSPRSAGVQRDSQQWRFNGLANPLQQTAIAYKAFQREFRRVERTARPVPAFPTCQADRCCKWFLLQSRSAGDWVNCLTSQRHVT